MRTLGKRVRFNHLQEFESPTLRSQYLLSVVVISVPLDNNKDYAFASLTTPKDRPVIVAGFVAQGLKKAAFIAKEILKLRNEN